MLLKRLELLGFKSFANRSVLEFEPGISALVGPNGSGKSNVADAVRWVLGEQSARALRGRRPDEVIFVGSADRHPLGMAEVALVLDNSSHRLALDFAEVRIARRLFRSGESEYLINGTRSRRKDLVALMLEAGLHSEGYTVIGQGAVEALVLQRPDERRGMLEHAADISRHQARLSEARSRLAATAQNLTRCRDILAELEPRARRLRLQAQKAELYVGKRTELQALADSYYRAALADQGARQSAAAAALDAASASCERLERAIAGLEQVRRQSRAQLDAVELRLAELRAGSDQLQQQRAATLRELGTTQQRVASLQARVETLEAEIARRARQAAELRTELAATANLGAAPAEAEPDDLERLEERVNQRRAGLDRARAELAALEAERGRLSRARGGLERDLQRLREQGAREQQARTDAERRRATDQARLETARAALHQVEAELQLARGREPELSTGLAAALAARQQAAAGLRAERQAEQQARAELAVASAALRELASQSDQLAAASGAGAPTKRLAADLGLPPELETAVGAALGEWAAALVCPAERAELLLEGAVSGRCLVVGDSPRQQQIERARCFEQQVEQLLGELWYRLLPLQAGRDAPGLGPLGHTVIVRDLAAARTAAGRLATALSGAWQVATLDGRVITHHGGLAVGVERELDRLVSYQRRQREAQERVTAAQRAASQAEETRAAAERRLSQAEADEREAQDRMAALRAELNLLGRRVQQLESASRQHAATLASQTASTPLSDQAAGEGRLLDAQRELEQQAERLTERDAAARETVSREEQAWESAWAERDAVRRRVDQAAAERRSAGERRAARTAALERLERERAQLAGQSAAARRELTDLEPGVEALEQGLVELQHRLEASAERLAAAAAGRQALLDQADRADERVSGLRAELLRARDGREKLLLAAQQASDELSRTEAELQSVAEEWGLGGEAVVQLGLPGAVGPLPLAAAASAAPQPVETSAPIDLAAARRRLLALQRELRGIGAVSDSVLEEYREVDERVQFLTAQSADLESAITEVEGAIAELEALMRGGFGQAFERVNEAFGRTFETLFGGGTARLVLTDPSDPLTTGVEIVAQPPGKRLQNLMSLSGGERALTSTALIFALLAINPLPFCVLDEVDAALDETNARRFAALLHQFSKQTQFIIVTHNRATMEIAGSLYGVSMGGDGVTTVLSLRLGEALAHSRNGQDSRGSESILQT
jgi:chromosome segregation protein